jgi:hypothetical protein
MLHFNGEPGQFLRRYKGRWQLRERRTAAVEIIQSRHFFSIIRSSPRMK